LEAIGIAVAATALVGAVNRNNGRSVKSIRVLPASLVTAVSAGRIIAILVVRRQIKLLDHLRVITTAAPATVASLVPIICVAMATAGVVTILVFAVVVFTPGSTRCDGLGEDDDGRFRLYPLYPPSRSDDIRLRCVAAFILHCMCVAETPLFDIIVLVLHLMFLFLFVT